MYVNFNALGYTDQQVEDIRGALGAAVRTPVTIDDKNTQFLIRKRRTGVGVDRYVLLRMTKGCAGFNFLVCTGSSRVATHEKLKAKAYLEDRGAMNWTFAAGTFRVAAKNKKGKNPDWGNVLTFCPTRSSVPENCEGRVNLAQLAAELLRSLDSVDYFEVDLTGYREVERFNYDDEENGSPAVDEMERRGGVGRLSLQRALCENVLRRFLDAGLPWIESKVGRGASKQAIVVRKIAENKIRLHFHMDRTLISCEMTHGDFANHRRALEDALRAAGLVLEDADASCVSIVVRETLSDGVNIDGAVMTRIVDAYRLLTAQLVVIGCCQEKLDPQRQQIPVPHDCVEDMDGLRGSLVFAMSHGSHELFHTNVWAWLIQRNPEFARVFFPHIVGEVSIVRREQGNRDLTIWTTEDGIRRAYVVENKFKSLPREDQLQEYQAVLHDEFAGGLLVTLAMPQERFDAGVWSVCTQEEVCSRIEALLAGDPGLSELEVHTIREYITMTRRLSTVLTNYADALGERWALALCRNRGDENVVGDLEDIKLADVFRKLNADRLVDYIEHDDRFQRLRDAVEGFADRRLRLEVSHSFLHKCPVVNAEVVWRYDLESPEKKLAIGAMLQWNSLARCTCSFDVDRYESPQALYREFSADGMWFDDAGFLRPGLKNFTKQFKSYETDKYVVAYQDIGIEDDGFEYLMLKIVDQLTLVWQMVEDGRLNEFFGFDEECPVL